jgi:hypothetical protein
MRLPLAAAFLALAVGVASVPVAAQSLGEVAAREKAKKEKAAREGRARPPAKVITEDELRGRMGAGTLSQPAAEDNVPTATPAPATPAAIPGQPAAAPEKTEDELRAERVAEWRQKLQTARADVATLRARRDQIQAALSDMSGPIYGPNRASIASQLEQTRTQLAATEQTVANLEEEGRRNGYR